MATLADVNNSLIGLQQANADGDAKQAALLTRLDKRFDKFFRQLEEIESEDQEADIEARNQSKKAEEKNEVSRSKGGGSGFSMPPIFGGLFAGGLTGAIAGIGGALLKRGIPGLIITVLADEIADYLQDNVSGVSQSMRDMVERSLSIGGLGLIFGPKFALIGAALGAVLTDENREKLSKLGDTASGLADKFTKMFNVQFPSLEEILNGITTTVGGAIDGIDKLLQGDFKGFIKEIDDVGLAMAGLFALFMPGKAISLALRGLMLPFVAAKAGIMAMLGKNKTDVNNLTNQTKTNMSGNNKGITKGGEKVTFNDKTQRFHSDKTNKMVKADDVKKIGEKFPRLKNLLRVPGLAQAFAALDLFQLLTTPGSVKDKVAGMSGILGGLGGSVLGAIAGTALGGLTGPAAVVMSPLLGALGGMGGYFFGDMIAKGISQYLLGAKVDAFPEIVNNALNGEATSTATLSSTAVPTGVDPGLTNAVSQTRTVSSVPNMTGTTMAASTAAMSVGPPNTQNIIDASTSTVDASTSQGIAMGNVNATDPNDLMFPPSF